MVEHYGTVKGNLQAGAVTYFAFLSFFPILALASSSSAASSTVFPDARGRARPALESLLPGIFGPTRASSRRTFQQSGTRRWSVVSLLGLLYAGLGWLSAMRDALIVMFELPAREQPNFVFGKLRDLVSLVAHRRHAAAERRGRRVRQRLRRPTSSTGSGSARSSRRCSDC